MSRSRIRPGTIARSVAGYSTLVSSIVFFLTTTAFVEPRRVLGPIKAQLRAMFRAFGMHITVTGLENLQPGRTYLFMCNHVSLLDHFILLAHLPGYFVGLEKIEARRVPLYGWAANRWGQIHIDRSSQESSREACQAVVDRLSRGLSVAVFPEGTRTRDGRLRPFKKGVFHIAVDARAEVVPVVLKGLYPVAPRGAIVMGSGPVELRVGKPLQVPPPSPDAHAALSAQVRAAMLEALGEEDRPSA